MDTTWMETACRDVVSKIERNSQRIEAGFPNGSVNGRYQLAVAHDWIAGFWPGMLWTVYEETGNDRLKELAVQCEQKISRSLWESFEQLHHDVGFMFELSSIKQFRIIRDAEARSHGLMAASLLAGRFNPAGGFIRAWPNWGDENHTGWAIIDCMMNLPLLYWASKEISDPRYQHIAELHADTVIREFIRADGSVHHIVCFDPHTGKRIEALAGQGYSADSAWSRGAAWALYGFTLSYKYTGRSRYLDSALKVAGFFLDHLPEDLIPYWDMRLPEAELRNMPRDSSAAAPYMKITALWMRMRKVCCCTLQAILREIYMWINHSYMVIIILWKRLRSLKIVNFKLGRMIL